MDHSVESLTQLLTPAVGLFAKLRLERGSIVAPPVRADVGHEVYSRLADPEIHLHIDGIDTFRRICSSPDHPEMRIAVLGRRSDGDGAPRLRSSCSGMVGSGAKSGTK